MLEQGIVIGDKVLTYDELGSGPTLLMIHGMGSIWKKDDPTLPELAKHFRIILLHLPGYPGSTPLDRKGLKEYAGVLAEFCRRLPLKEGGYFLGHSFGTYIVSEFAHRHPWFVKKLILVGAPIHLPPEARKVPERLLLLSFFLVRFEVLRGAISDLLGPTKFGKEWLKERDYLTVDPKTLKVNLETLLTVPLLALAQKVSVPKLFIWGENDPLYREEEGQKIADRKVFIPKAGHGMEMFENPQIYAGVVREFLLG